MLRPEEQLRSTVPDCHYYFVSLDQRLERLVSQSRQAEIPDLDHTFVRYQNVRRLEISVEYMGAVKIHEAIKKLMDKGLEYRRPQWLSQVRVMVN